MGERADRLRQPQDISGVWTTGDDEIQHTREEISETLEAIEAKLAPERLTNDAKDAAQDTADHLIEEAKEAVGEWTEVASVAAMEAVDYALRKVQESLPDLSHQAQDAASGAVDHAIEEAKAAVRELTEQARTAVRDATIGRVERMAQQTSETSKYVGSTTIQRIKQNPGPAALTALGISWLFLSGKGGQGQTGQSTGTSARQGGSGLADQAQSTVGEVTQTASDVAGQVGGSVSSTADQVQQTATDLAGQVQSGLSTAVDQVEQTAGQVAGQAQETVIGAAGQVQETAGQLATQVQQVPGKTRRMIEENSLPLGLVALALGSAAALAIPETRKENELMGEARDAAIQAAQAKGQQAVEKAQDVVEGMQTVAEGVEETVEKATN
jgi:hypothetical protein